MWRREDDGGGGGGLVLKWSCGGGGRGGCELLLVVKLMRRRRRPWLTRAPESAVDLGGIVGCVERLELREEELGSWGFGQKRVLAVRVLNWFYRLEVEAASFRMSHEAMNSGRGSAVINHWI